MDPVPRPPDQATDQETVDFLEGHIDNPCGTVVGGITHSIREFYLRLLEAETKKMTDPAAKQKAEDILSRYNWPPNQP